MKIKNVKLEWYAFRYNMNKNKIEWFNILGDRIKDTIVISMHKNKLANLEDLKNLLITEFRYYYWSKAEHEVAISNIIDLSFEKAEKIDVYAQLQPNISRIAEYINNEMQLNLY